jgi:hypothetical protein
MAKPKQTRGRRSSRRRAAKTQKGDVRILRRVWSPVDHLFQATGESAQTIGSSSGRIVKEGVLAVNSVGKSFARHGNMAIAGLVYGKRETRRLGRR